MSAGNLRGRVLRRLQSGDFHAPGNRQERQSMLGDGCALRWLEGGRISHHFSRSIVPCVLGALTASALCTDALYPFLSHSLTSFGKLLPNPVSAAIVNDAFTRWLMFALLAGSIANLALGAVGLVQRGTRPRDDGASRLAGLLAERDATIRDLGDRLSQFAQENENWERHAARLDTDLAESKERCRQITAERNALALELGQLRTRLSKPNVLPDFFGVLLVAFINKHILVLLHPDKGDPHTREDRQRFCQQWSQVVDYVRK